MTEMADSERFRKRTGIIRMNRGP